MINKTRLFTPGPTPLLPASQFAMAAADIHHRTPEFRAMFLKVLKQLQGFIGTSNDVVVLTCSGTGAMEAAVSNLTNPGDTVLVISAGKFGERWVSLAKTYGCKVRLASAPYGQTVPMEDGAGAVHARGARRLRAGHRDLDGRTPLHSRDQRAGSRQRRHAGGRRHYRAGYNRSRRERGGRDHRRIAEGADDPARTFLSGGERARLEAHGDHQSASLLLPSAQGAQVAGQGRIRLHAFGGADCRPGSGAGLPGFARRRRRGRRAVACWSTTPNAAPP